MTTTAPDVATDARSLLDEVTQFIYREARLQDDHAYDEWEALWTDDGVYWIPANGEGGDPEKEMSIVYDNRSRIRVRIEQLKTGRRHTQTPRSELARLISNIEIGEVTETEVTVFANSMIYEDNLRGETVWATRNEYRLRLVGGALVLAAVTVAWPKPETASLVTWVPYREAALEEAQRATQPILIDIYADWCLPCVEMDHVTFRQPAVVDALASVATLRVDATREVSEEAERLLQRHQIYGAPTILFFDRTGRERADLRLTGFVNAKEFLERLEQIL